MKKRNTAGLILLVLLLAACAPAAAEPAQPVLVTTQEASMEEQPATEPSIMGNPPASTPEWFGEEMTDVNTGMTFKISDFHGKVVLVETMAVWCPTCLQQQVQIAKLLNNIDGRDDLVAVSIDIDTNEDVPLITAHTTQNKLEWIFTIAPEKVVNQIGDLYGAQFLNPPSVPMFIIDRQGNVHPLPFGVKSAEELQTSLQPYLDET